MTSFIRQLRLLLLGLWLGAAVFFGAAVAPALFNVLRSAGLVNANLVDTSIVSTSLGIAVLVSLAHSAAMIAAGAGVAWLVYRFLGLKFVARSWFNLDTVWAVSLILVGTLALAISVRG